MDCKCDGPDGHCCFDVHFDMIDVYYNDIVECIQLAAQQSVVRVPSKSLKPYWNDELDHLEQAAISWHDIWTSAGIPQSGQLFHIKCSTKLKYRLAIRDAYIELEDSHDYELYRHFAGKRISEFWKSLNAKSRRNINKNVGCRKVVSLTKMFASHFANV